jgi:hypothetical protein
MQFTTELKLWLNHAGDKGPGKKKKETRKSLDLPIYPYHVVLRTSYQSCRILSINILSISVAHFFPLTRNKKNTTFAHISHVAPLFFYLINPDSETTRMLPKGSTVLDLKAWTWSNSQKMRRHFFPSSLLAEPFHEP